jgi:hypothetical protein
MFVPAWPETMPATSKDLQPMADIPAALAAIGQGFGSVFNIERSCGRLGGYAGWWFSPHSGLRRGSDLDRIRNELALLFHPPVEAALEA